MLRRMYYGDNRLIIQICRGIAVALAVFIGILLWLNGEDAEEIEQVIAKMNEELRPLSVEKNRLEEEIDRLQSEQKALTAGTATMQFLITDLSESTYKKIIQPMSEYEYPVALGVSLEQMPGVEGNISMEVAEELLIKGWYLCYSFSEEEAGSYEGEARVELSLWLDEVQKAADQEGLTIDNAIYFPAGTFREEYISVLKEQGIEVVIHTGNIGKKLLAAEWEQDIWYVGGIWWRGNEILADKLSTIQYSGGEFVTIMGVDDTATNSLKDWMVQFQGIAKAVSVCDFATMTQTQSANRELGKEEEVTFEEEIKSLQSEIEAIETRMDEIQQKYMEEMKGKQ